MATAPVPRSNPGMPSSRSIVFPAKQQVQLEEFVLPELKPDQVRVRTEISLMSTGTENTVFNRLFDPGTLWDRWVKYPFYPGYSAVGVIESVGEKVAQWKPGDRVAIRSKHASHSVAAADGVFAIPDSLSFEHAVWFALAKIAFHAVWAAECWLGDSVLVIGAGPIGQMAVRWARAAGAVRVLVVDEVPGRLAMARSGGAAVTIAQPIQAAREEILEGNGGGLPRIVIDSTGNAAVFAAALGLAADRGTVVILGDTGRPTTQTLTPDVLVRGLHIVGVHDGHSNAVWNNASITSLFCALATDGRFPLEGLNTHVFKPSEANLAYELANRDRASTMGILFDWRKS